MSGSPEPPKPAAVALAIYSASPRSWQDLYVYGDGRARRYFIRPVNVGGHGADYETTKSAIMARVRASAKPLGFNLGMKDSVRVLDALVEILPA